MLPAKFFYQFTGLWNFMKKGEYFDFNYLLGSLPCLYTRIRLLGQVYHFSQLICYPYSFIVKSDLKYFSNNT